MRAMAKRRVVILYTQHGHYKYSARMHNTIIHNCAIWAAGRAKYGQSSDLAA